MVDIQERKVNRNLKENRRLEAIMFGAHDSFSQLE